MHTLNPFRTGALAKAAAVAFVIPFALMSASTATAAVIFSNMTMTAKTFSVDISGTTGPSLPASNRNILWFVNTNVAATPGFILDSTPSFTAATSHSSTLSQSLDAGAGALVTGAQGLGDYFVIEFAGHLGAGETISGTVSGTWASPVFDPTAVTAIDVFWGRNGSGADSGNLLQGNAAVAVPEPSSIALLGLGGVTMLLRRKRG